jgi:CheY-like chemotaxis protein
MHTQRQIEAVDILVVDPRVEHYHAFSAAMSELGISYQSARDGHQALQFAARKPGRIWLANLQLPDMTGIELLRLVRAKRPTTPFYLVSDFYSPEDERQARAAGAAEGCCPARRCGLAPDYRHRTRSPFPEFLPTQLVSQ